MPSLYSEYLAEMTQDRILETPTGFASYRYLKEDDIDSVYVIDIFTVKEHRKTGQASLLVDLIVDEARRKGCKQLLGTVRPSSLHSTKNLQSYLNYGCVLKSSVADCIILRKDI